MEKNEDRKEVPEEVIKNSKILKAIKKEVQVVEKGGSELHEYPDYSCHNDSEHEDSSYED